MEVFLKGVYFLYDGDKIVYIGKSGDIYRRIYEHSSGRAKGEKKKFDSWRYIPIEDEFGRSQFEEICIRMFNPKYNIDRREHFAGMSREEQIDFFEKTEPVDAQELYLYTKSVSPEDLDRFVGIRGAFNKLIEQGRIDKKYLIFDGDIFNRTRIRNEFILDYGGKIIEYKKKMKRGRK